MYNTERNDYIMTSVFSQNTQLTPPPADTVPRTQLTRTRSLSECNIGAVTPPPSAPPSVMQN